MTVEILQDRFFKENWINCSRVSKSTSYDKIRENLKKIDMLKIIEPGTVCFVIRRDQSHAILVLKALFVKQDRGVQDYCEKIVLIIYYDFTAKSITCSQLNVSCPRFSLYLKEGQQ